MSTTSTDRITTLLRSTDPISDTQANDLIARLVAAGLCDQIVTVPRRPRPGSEPHMFGDARVSRWPPPQRPQHCSSSRHGQRPARPQPAQAVTFEIRGNYIIAPIRDPYADAAQLRSLFARHRLNIAVHLLPTSPSLIGTMVAESGSAVDPLQKGQCINGPCTIGLQIPRDFSGRADVYLGRPARKNETYASAAISSFAPGEALHCTRLLGAPAPNAAAMLRKMGLQVQWRNSSRAVLGTPPGASQYAGWPSQSRPSRS